MPGVHEGPSVQGGGAWISRGVGASEQQGLAVMGWTWRLCVRPGVEVRTGAGRLRWHVTIACDCESLFTAVSRL